MFRKVTSIFLVIAMIFMILSVECITTAAGNSKAPAESAAGKSTVTVTDWTGAEATKAVEVGDEITVTSYLKVPDGKKVNSIDIQQEFNIGAQMLELLSDVDDEETFPNFNATASVEGNSIWANGSAAKYKKAFTFASEDSVLIRAKYKVVAAGNCKVKTDIITLATVSADESMSNQILSSEKVGNDKIITGTTLDAPAHETPATEPAASGKSTVTVTDWTGAEATKAVKVGDEITVTSYLKVPDGKKVNSIDIQQEFNIGSQMLELLSDVDDEETFPNFNATASVEGNSIWANGSAAKYKKAFTFASEDSVLIRAKYKVVAAGNCKVKTDIITLATVSADESMSNQIFSSEKVGNDKLITRTTLDTSGHEVPATQAPATEPAAADKGTVTVTDWTGAEATKAVEVGDEITVTCYLKVPDGKRVNSIDIQQEFNIGAQMLKLLSDVDDEETFPNFNATANVAGSIIKANASAAKYKKAFTFDSEDSVLIQTKYKVVAVGNCKVKTDIITLATVSADESMSNQIFSSEKVGNDKLIIRTTLDTSGHEVPATQAPATQAPATEAPSIDGVLVIADGVTYNFRKNDVFTYKYYLSIPESVHSLEAQTVYQAAGLKLLSDIDDEETFPVLGGSVLANEESAGTILYNFSSAKKGKNFTAADSVLITVQFKVTAESGTYTVDTDVIYLAGPDEHIFIYDGEAKETITKSGSDIFDVNGKEKTPYTGPTAPATEAPAFDGVIVIADGVTYDFRKDDVFTYKYYLSVPEKVHSLEAQTVYQALGLELLSDIDDEETFPVLGGSVLANEESAGTILYNFSSAKKGKDFTDADSVMITVQFKVAAESGTYTVDTDVINLAGPDEHLFIHDGEPLEEITVGEANVFDVNGKVKAPYSGTVSILGDVDGDGKVDVFDASSIQKSLAGTVGYARYDTLNKNDIAFRVADIDGNGTVDVFDAAAIQKWIAGDTSVKDYGIGEQF